MSKKDEIRQNNAKRRVKLPALYIMLQEIYNTWNYGIDGGGRHQIDTAYFDFVALDVQPKEKSVIKMMLGAINKVRLEALDVLLNAGQFESFSKNFFDDCAYYVELVEKAAWADTPKGTSVLDVHRCTTYVTYALYHDWLYVSGEERPEFWALDSKLGAFCNYLLPRQRRQLVDAMNKVYWGVRETVLTWPDHWPNYLQSEEEKLREKEALKERTEADHQTLAGVA